MFHLGRIFISYRRADLVFARTIYGALADAFGRDHVFFDLLEIGTAEDFVERLNRELARTDVFIAIVGRNWHLGRRLFDPHDFVRREIMAALDARIPAFPVFEPGVPLPSEGEIPNELRPLLRLNGPTIDAGPHFEHSLQVLVKKVRGLLPIRRRLLATALITAILVIVGIGAVFFIDRSRGTPPPTASPQPSAPASPAARPVEPPAPSETASQSSSARPADSAVPRLDGAALPPAVTPPPSADRLRTELEQLLREGQKQSVCKVSGTSIVGLVLRCCDVAWSLGKEPDAARRALSNHIAGVTVPCTPE